MLLKHTVYAATKERAEDDNIQMTAYMQHKPELHAVCQLLRRYFRAVSVMSLEVSLLLSAYLGCVTPQRVTPQRLHPRVC